MNDLISRQDAIDYFVTNVGFHDEDGYSIDDSDELRKIWTDYFDGIPSAERHGRWIIYTVSPWDGEDVKCSVCGEKGCAPYWDYCPHCGSQMVDVVSENEL